MTPVLRLRDAAFSGLGRTIVPPTTLDVPAGARIAHLCATEAHARGLALVAAGLVHATSGTVSIGEYDPRVQPVHCRRIAAYVPHDPLPMSQPDFTRYVQYRAALWDIDPARATAHARLLLERLDGLHEAFAYPIVVALLPSPQVLVLDRPQLVYAHAILSAIAPCAIFSTHLDERTARAYAETLVDEVVPV